MNELQFVEILNFQTENNLHFDTLKVSFQIFGKPLNSAPVVLVNHALTGNSDICSEQKGWWKPIIGKDKLIDTQFYTVLTFNVPGNGYDGLFIEDFKIFTTRDIAQIIAKSLEILKIQKLFAAIGGSIGGGIAWELAVLEPNLIENLIPVATDWKASDWIIAQNFVQEEILLHSTHPIEDARKFAMIFYRTPESLEAKFGRTKTSDNQMFNIESWLAHHGKKLKQRFDIRAYLLMNRLLSTLDISKHFENFDEAVAPIQSRIIQVAVDSDLMFLKSDIYKTHERLLSLGKKSEYHEIKSIHGHDAFLIEFEQLTKFLEPTLKI